MLLSGYANALHRHGLHQGKSFPPSLRSMIMEVISAAISRFGPLLILAIARSFLSRPNRAREIGEGLSLSKILREKIGEANATSVSDIQSEANRC